MAEQSNDKPKFPLAGLFALLGMISGLLFYEGISLKTSRPVDKEKATNILVKKSVVQSRLWQDPFEAMEAHQALEQKLTGQPEEKNGEHTLDKLIEVIEQSGISNLRILPVFVDGSPYVNGAESRLNDRYAVVSALGAAGYLPESGEYIRFFKWRRTERGKQENDQEKKTGTRSATPAEEIETLVPAEFYLPKAELRHQPYGKPVLVLWLKEQDANANPLLFLNDLLAYFRKGTSKASPGISLAYDVVGPHSSATFSAMLKELEPARSGAPALPFNMLAEARFFSPWATAEDTFLLDYSPEPEASVGLDKGGQRKERERKPADELLAEAKIHITRTIGTDAALAEQLLQELRRRQIDLKPCMDKHCNPKVALISEWDTLYGRALPRTFAAVTMNKGSGQTGPDLEAEINKLRRDEWPGWIYRHSYLAGLDGELPVRAGDRSDDKDKDSNQSGARMLPGGKPQATTRNSAPRPEGRGQLDYVVRLAAVLKQEEAKNGEEFKAIGVLGSDVYDKLLILQALRHTFPRAIFFTTDLNARLSYPTEWQWTHNLVIASHFGLELQPALQIPIPPFRDSYQTSLFYSTLWALDHFIAAGSPECPECFRLRRAAPELGTGKPAGPVLKFSSHDKPRLYEVGRQGAFDISMSAHSSLANAASIHPPRHDLGAYTDPTRNLRLALGATATIAILVLGAMLLSNTAAAAVFKLTSRVGFWIFLILTGLGVYGAAIWVRRSTPDLSQNEPFVLTEGISAWPTAVIELLALLMSLIFLWSSWRKLKGNEKILTHEFGLEGRAIKGTNGKSQNDFPMDYLPENKLSATGPLSGSLPFGSFRRGVEYLTGLNTWRSPAAGEVDAAQLWSEYETLGSLKNVFIRCLPQALVALCFIWLMMALFGFPNIPCRGGACFAINKILLAASITTLVFLVCYVLDVTILCRRWVSCIAANRISWPEATLEKISAEQGVARQNLNEWLGIELIAERTKVIGNFIYFPFITMLVLGIARYRYFDNWDFPSALILVFALNAILLVGNALTLRRSAEAARREAIRRLKSKLTGISGQIPEEIKQRQQIAWAMDTIRNNQRGAFLPFTQHPIFGAAIALPSGGYGLVLLLEYLATGVQN
ncbi:MAG TPA: hypothetical protein VFI43_03145 [Nitrosospira sp.]|nr:hypothetical protein [Nitrosospira sp.]